LDGCGEDGIDGLRRDQDVAEAWELSEDSIEPLLDPPLPE
jgi:hypothetical protein